MRNSYVDCQVLNTDISGCFILFELKLIAVKIDKTDSSVKRRVFLNAFNNKMKRYTSSIDFPDKADTTLFASSMSTSSPTDPENR